MHRRLAVPDRGQLYLVGYAVLLILYLSLNSVLNLTNKWALGWFSFSAADDGLSYGLQFHSPPATDACRAHAVKVGSSTWLHPEVAGEERQAFSAVGSCFTQAQGMLTAAVEGAVHHWPVFGAEHLH